MSGAPFPNLPTARPKLPTADAILVYLQQIDCGRWYTNFGPLVRRFEAELAAHIGAEAESVVTVSNATAGLTLALQDCIGAKRGLCILPSWTFVATGIAAVNAGLTPFFVDIDPGTWQLTPSRARRAIAHAPGEVCALISVAPFGAPVDVDAWATFSAETGVAVVVDAAAGFDTAKSHTQVISVVSLHATKPLSAGEGGFILAGTSARGERLRRMSNFGMNSQRESILMGTNAKLSEYTAAVGLAALAQWPATRAALIDRATAFNACLADIAEIAIAPTGLGQAAATTYNVVMREPVADEAIAWMVRLGVEARKWWPRACHRHAIFADYPHDDLSETEELVRRVLALPFWIDMTDADQQRIADALRLYCETLSH